MNENDWARRHRVVVGILAVHAPALVLIGWLRGVGFRHIAEELVPLAVVLAAALHRGLPPRYRSVVASFGLMTVAAIAVQLAGGQAEAHFLYFVLLAVLALYDDWLPFAVAVGFVIVQHAVLGAVEPEAVWGSSQPMTTSFALAAVHGGFVLADSVVTLVAWRWRDAARSAAQSRLAESEARLSALIEHGSDLIAISDGNGSLVFASDTFRRALGIDPEDDGNVAMAPYVHEDDCARLRDERLRITQTDGASASVDCRLRNAEGQWRWVEATITNRLQHPAVRGFVVNVRDITERVLAAERLSREATHDALTGLPTQSLMEDRLLQTRAAALRHRELVAALFVDLDDFRSTNQTYGQRTADRLLVEVASRLRGVVRLDDTVARVGGDEFVVVATVPEGSDAQTLASRVRAVLSEPYRLPEATLSASASIGLATTEDADDCIDLLEAANLALYEAKAAGGGVWVTYRPPMRADGAPGLPSFDHGRLGEERALASRYRAQIAESEEAVVVHVDGVVVAASPGAIRLLEANGVDDFIGRRIFDLVLPEDLDRAYGRQEVVGAGGWPKPDVFRVETMVGNRLALEVTSTPAFWGGRLASQMTLRRVEDGWRDIVRLGMELTEALPEAMIMTDLDLTIVGWNDAAVSVYGWLPHEVIGLNMSTAVPWIGSDMDLAAARHALETTGRWSGRAVQARRDGSPVEVAAVTQLIHDASGRPIGIVSANRPVHAPDGGGFEDAELADELDRGIAGGELVLHYQPIVDPSGAVAKVEALVRWQHPDRGLLAPNAFVHVAERSGSIGRLSGTVLRMACEQVQAWRRTVSPNLQVTVNISGRDLSDDHLVDRVLGALEASGLPPSALWLEITETALAHDIDAARERLRALVATGVRVALDDFGTGFATLAQLHQFPVHALKVDRMFVDRITEGGDDIAIVRSVLALGRELGLDVIAEGVETADQRRVLAGLGCKLFQGYFFSKPTPAEPLPSWIAAGAGATA